MKSALLSVFIMISIFSAFPQETEIVYLSGKGTDDAVEWDFYCTKGRKSGEWTKIPVPSNWELHGFGNYNYGHDSNKSDEEGLYRKTFFAPEQWKKNSLRIVFVASMTDTEVKINGKSAGPVHQGGFYTFEYDISKLIKYDADNLLEVKVSKNSSNKSVNAAERNADYWIFGGIFRPVYLKIMPEEHIDRVAVDAQANGNFYAEVFTSGIQKSSRLELKLFKLDGEQIGKTVSFGLRKKEKLIKINKHFDQIKSWNPENPELYEVVFTLYQGNTPVHIHKERIGFRTIEVRQRDGIYLNGRKIMFKGVNRHSFWPETGRALNKKLSIKDALLIKDMNMNAVRMSHYPPDPHFLDICDSLGLMVLNELAGWQRPAYDTEIGEKLVNELVTRDVNHPCIVLWDNGNEGGWNIELDDDFSIYDPQNRTVIHPWELHNGIDTRHYRDWNYGSSTFFNGREIFLPTEFLHGLYDGGHGAGLEDWWNLMSDKPLSAGGFLWDFADEGVVRTDKEGIIDTDGNHAPDGIVGPYREKEGSYYAIKEIWSPVHILQDFIPPEFNGSLPLENNFIFTDLGDCRFYAQWVRNLVGKEPDTLMLPVKLNENIRPGNKGTIQFDLPWEANQKFKKKDFHILIFSVNDPFGRNIMTWQWPLLSPMEFSKSLNSGVNLSPASATENEDQMILSANNTDVYISKLTATIDSVIVNGKNSGFSGGRFTGAENLMVKNFTLKRRGGMFSLNFIFEENKGNVIYEMTAGSWLKINHNLTQYGKHEYSGLNFNYPENNILGVEMLADGPYRVWKNRIKGPQFGYWKKNYNNTITGESWDYPEFKGYYSNFYMAKIISSTQNFICCTESDDIYLRLLTPANPAGAGNKNTSPSFPTGDISFMTSINPIGTKFKKAENHGPMGQLNDLSSWSDDRAKPLVLYFNFEAE